MKTFLLASFFIIISNSSSTSQEIKMNKIANYDTRLIKSPYTLGFFGGLNNIISDAEIPVIPQSFECGVYRSSNTNSFYIGGNFNFNIYNNWIFPEIRVLYEKRPIAFSHINDEFEILNTISNKYEQLITEQKYIGSLDYLLFDFGVKINPLGFASLLDFVPNDLGKTPLFIRIGFEAGNPLFNTEFENLDEIVSPVGITFPDQKKIDFIEKGTLDRAGTAYGLVLTLTGDIKIGKNTFMSPEFTFRYGLNSPVTDVKWQSDIIRLGIGINHLFNTEIPEPKLEVKIKEPIEPEKKKEVVEVINTENIVRFSGNYINTVETIVTQTYPILPYIFFNFNSSEIRNVYSQDNLSFNKNNLPKNTLGIYYRVLDLIGERLKSNPNTEITLRGLTDGNELDSLENRLELAKSRAETIANYFVNNWGIDVSRIKVIYDDTPAISTSIIYKEGAQENRRVEILSEDTEILEPVLHSKFLEYNTNKDALDYNVETNWSGKGEMTLELFDDGQLIGSKTVIGDMEGERIISFENELIDNLSKKNMVNKLLTARLTLSKLGQDDEIKEVFIPYKKSQNQFEVGRLNLIVFDFDRSDISKQNADMIKDFINSAIAPNSISVIKGSTDRLGEFKYNKSLSLARAKSVEKFIKGFKPDYKFDKVEGLGSSQLLFDNDLPEGRFYCRTVLVEVKTPLETDIKKEDE